MTAKIRTTPKFIEGAWQFALDLLFPKICVSCKSEGAFLCSPCKTQIRVRTPSCLQCHARSTSGKTCTACRNKTGITRFFAPFSYRDAIPRELVHRYKYGRIKELAEALAEPLIAMLHASNFRPRGDMIIVPIPLHSRRKRERGFNQSELLARHLGDTFELPVATTCLNRVKNTMPQISLENDKERGENISGAFSVADPASIGKKTVLLVDDVVTSGATLKEAAFVLRKAGARSVWGLAIARR